jgi:hypothetical protein
MQPALTREEFFELTASAVAGYIAEAGRPKVGVFVPDGNRRMILAYTALPNDSEAFHTQLAANPANPLLSTPHLFFDHGLPTLVIPLFSRSVLARSPEYRLLTALKIMRLLFTDEEGDDWPRFYEQYGVRVRVYGDPQQLAGMECEPALKWIARVQGATKGTPGPPPWKFVKYPNAQPILG